MPKAPQTTEEWLACLELTEYLAMIPTGQIRHIVGPIIWVDGTGSKMSTEQYIKRWGFDPQIAWDAIKEYRKQAGKNDHVMRL
jgi:N6-adenosine-specific RNA methylase IME4